MSYSCQIKFTNTNDVVYAGERLMGELELTLDKPRKYKGIYVVINGYSETEWRDKEKTEVDGETKKKREHYKGRLDYFNEIHYLLAQSDGIPVELSSGRHKFNFAYTLPAVLPPSWTGEFGHVTYRVKAVLDRPWRPDETHKKNFIVMTRYMITQQHFYPQKLHEVEQLWCLPFHTMPFTVEAEVAKTGFCLNEGVPVIVRIQNESNSTIHEIKFQLRQIISFFSVTPRRQKKESINKMVDIRCKVMDSRKIGLFQRTLVLPQLPVTFESTSDLLGISYEVRIEVKVGGLNKNPVVRIPIIIGNQSTEPNAPAESPTHPIYPTLLHHQSFSSGNAILNTSMWSTASQQMDISTTSDASNPSVSVSNDFSTNSATAAPPSYDDAVSANLSGLSLTDAKPPEVSQKS
ncbi:arrestin domain-containing protein 17-like isoform X1 [Lutzomyia longipalpis]|uniref:Putative arrestin domain-containing protein 3 n=1 Tax=Lutzomyia longipalpis TaxID=7200 RepID=A0A1B0ETZ9_LUTLO|nr:arrestin domain-containing protein 17-like isoform X1 [Lutzomyia longipalpis]